MMGKGGRALRLGQPLKVTAWEIALLGSCNLGKFAWELKPGIMPMGKYLTSYSLFRFILGAGGCVSWPAGRGIFLSSDRQLIVWVNEEDHLRIISLNKGGDLPSVYSR